MKQSRASKNFYGFLVETNGIRIGTVVMNSKSKSSIWLEAYIGHSFGQEVDLDSTDAFELRNFILLWNRYECLLLSSRCSVKKIWENEGDFRPSEEATQRFFRVISSRYSNTVFYDALHFEKDGCPRNDPDSYKKKVRDILDETNPSIPCKECVCRMVIWRYRNNLFHGIKELPKLWDSQDLFHEANLFLLSGLSTKTGVYLPQELQNER